MNRKAGLLWLAALVALVVAAPAHAQSNGSNGADRTIWDGVYTDAQAERGQRAVQQNCGSCHSGTEWSSAAFISAWAGRPVGELHSHLQMTMPMDAPGRLTPQQYADIVAYMLKINNAPAGATELPSDEAGLRRIEVTRRNR